MGLNLYVNSVIIYIPTFLFEYRNIRRIIFKTLHKFNGIDLEPVPTNQVKQIAGRAGRFGTLHEGGILTTLSKHDMRYLQQCMATPNENIKAAGLLPTSDHIVNISYAFPQLSLSEIIVHHDYLIYLI